MSKVYNTQENIATNLNTFFTKVCKSLSKVHLKLLPFIIIGMIDSESVVTNDIIKKLKGDFLLVKNESNQRRLRRFFNSNTFNIFHFYDCIIRHIVSNFKCRTSRDRIYISFDHCFCKNKFTILCFSFKIGKHAIPLWFRCFKGKHDSNAFVSSTINKGISYISDLFKDSPCKLVFLADRFFISTKIMNHINSLKHIYVIRSKNQFTVRVPVKNEKNTIRKKLSDITPFISKAIFFNNIYFTEKLNCKVNIAISKNNGESEPWYLLTNGDPKKAIKSYGYRWSIECFFKNEKTNGFYLESTNVRNTNAFSTMFGLSCVATLWLTGIGVYYSRNKGRKNCFITDNKKVKDVKKRIISIFNVGLIYFNIAYNSIKYLYLNYNFLINDV